MVVGLLVDAIRDLLVVLVTHAVVVGGLVDLCRQMLVRLDVYEQMSTGRPYGC